MLFKIKHIIWFMLKLYSNIKIMYLPNLNELIPKAFCYETSFTAEDQTSGT